MKNQLSKELQKIKEYAQLCAFSLVSKGHSESDADGAVAEILMECKDLLLKRKYKEVKAILHFTFLI